MTLKEHYLRAVRHASVASWMCGSLLTTDRFNKAVEAFVVFDRAGDELCREIEETANLR